MRFYEATAPGQLYRDWVSGAPRVAFNLHCALGSGCQPVALQDLKGLLLLLFTTLAHEHRSDTTNIPPFAPAFPGPGQSWAHGGYPLFQFLLCFTRWVHRQLGHKQCILPPSLSLCSPQEQGQAVPKCSQLPRTHGLLLGQFSQHCQTHSDRSLGSYKHYWDVYCSRWSATWAASCFLLAESSEGDNPSCLVSRDFFPGCWTSRARARLLFACRKLLARMHQFYLSFSQTSLSSRCYMRQRFTEEKTLKCRALKKTQPDPSSLMLEGAQGFSHGRFSQLILNSTRIPATANDLHNVCSQSNSPGWPSNPFTKIPGILTALPKRFLGLAKVWWAQQTEESKCSWAPRWSQLTSQPTNCSAVQTSGKQTAPTGGGLWENLNFLGKRTPSEPPVFLTESKLKNYNGRKASSCGFYTEAAIIQKHEFEVIQKMFHNLSNNLLNPSTNLILSFKNVLVKNFYFTSTEIF